MKKTGLSTTQKLAWVYAIGFYLITLLGVIPTFNDANGALFGLFKLGLQDNLLHLTAALWATYGAHRSTEAAKTYMLWFGLYYTIDAFVGMFTGYTIIDTLIGNWGANEGFNVSHVGHNFPLNLPHFILGPTQLLVGFFVDQNKAKKS